MTKNNELPEQKGLDAPLVNGWRCLHLSLKKEPFDVMVTGEKTNEYRKDAQWIRSRLFTPNGTEKKYDVVKFVNGYGADKPYFIARYLGYGYVMKDGERAYSTGFKLKLERGNLIIFLGQILETGNLHACR